MRVRKPDRCIFRAQPHIRCRRAAAWQCLALVTTTRKHPDYAQLDKTNLTKSRKISSGFNVTFR
jgi:hypothetical protein